MADLNPVKIWERFLARDNQDPVKAIGMAFIVAVICGVLVSATAVGLKPMQEANLAAEREARMQQMLAGLPGLADLIEGQSADSLSIRLVDLGTGTFAEGVDPETYDQRVAADDPGTRVEIPPDADIAGLGTRAPYAPVYLLTRGSELSLIVLPVRGSGYQSMLYGYLALEGDLDTVAGLSFYEQADTPGLGARIQDPGWEALWPGTNLTNEAGELSVAVVRGGATEPYEVDGISGATRTGNGVTNLLRYWLGADGFGPFLDNLESGEVTP